MSEAEKPKRRWFRFSLLTAVLMMLAFGALLAVETACRKSINHWIRTIVLSLLDVDAVTADEMAYLPPCILFNAVVVVGIGVILESIIRRREGRKP
jgi:hypothetical protein